MAKKLDPLSTDIYDITQSVIDLQKEMFTGLDSSTLSVGINGYLASIFATQLQNSVIVASELGNEIIPSKAKFEKNIIAHAIIQNITDLNATPALIPVMFGMAVEDIEENMVSDTFRFDRTSKIFINNMEFHFQYDIIIRKNINVNGQIIYSAIYDMGKKNPLSTISNPYIDSPIIQVYGGQKFLFFVCELMQIKLNTVQSKIITSTPIENKIFEFNYDEQLAAFAITVTENGKSTELTPVFEGIGVDYTITDFCYYSFIDQRHIRVTFDSASYLPQLNALVEAEIWTTSGEEGNFDYNESCQTILSSDNYGYRNIPIRLLIMAPSSGGVDKKSIDELRKMIPKEALSRGSISNATSLQNYFNMINTDKNILHIQKKVDNQFERTYYSYLVLKDKYDNVIPTNTINIRLNKSQFQASFNKKFVLLPGTAILLDKASGYGTIVDPDTMDVLDDKDRFLYILPMMIVMTDDPLYISYYSTIINRTIFSDFTYINTECPVQFVAPSVTWKRELTTDRNKYKMVIPMTQNILTDYRMMIFDATSNTLKTNNMRVFVVFYNSDSKGTPYGYVEASLLDYKYGQFHFDYGIELETSDQIDTKNRIRIENMILPGTDNMAYGYVTPNMKAEVYVCAKFGTSYGLNGLENIVPDLEGYSLTNMFTLNGGVDFYTSYTDTIKSIVVHKKYQDVSVFNDGYVIKSVPVVRYSYADEEDSMQNFMNELAIKKVYIDKARYILENNFEIDFKLFNTYGPSTIYTIDEEGEKPIGRVNLTLRFRLKLVQSSDQYTKQFIIKDVKDIIEDLNSLSSLHIPNLITTITNKYRNEIEYFEFLGFNDYGPGYQHLYRHDPEVVDTVPEFLTVHTNEDKTPDILIEMG